MSTPTVRVFRRILLADVPDWEDRGWRLAHAERTCSRLEVATVEFVGELAELAPAPPDALRAATM